MSKVPKALSSGEEEFALHCSAYKLSPVREYEFCEGRKWRADFAFVAEKVLVEIEGGTATGGRHTRPKGFAEDCIKYNKAALLGWRVLRFTGKMVSSGVAIDTVREVLVIKGNA